MPAVGDLPGWKVGAGNGPDVWGLEGELGGGVRGARGGSEGQEGAPPGRGGHQGSSGVHQAGPQAMSSVRTCTLPGFSQVSHQLPITGMSRRLKFDYLCFSDQRGYRTDTNVIFLTDNYSHYNSIS